MMIYSKKILSIIIALIYFSVPLLGVISADGGIFGKRETIFYLKENTQYAVIHHIAGRQRMIVSVNFDWKESNKTAWVFPVPSDPENVEIDVADGAPIFSGSDMVREAKDDLGEALNLFLVSYLVSIVIPVPFTLTFASIKFGGMMGGMMASSGRVDVHKHLEKYGLTIEVISATEGLGVYRYLKDNGLDISEGMVTQLDEYVEKDYSFVVTWISSENLSVREPGIIIEFPTHKIFYPMILTSIYGNEVIPIELMIVGHVSPIIFDEIEPYFSVSYWRGSVLTNYGYFTYQTMSPGVLNFTKNIEDNWEGKFTRIEINAPSSFFKEDLWIEKASPDEVEYAITIHNIFGEKTRFPTFLLLFLAFSLPIALILGIVVFGRKKEDIPYYLLMGLGNLVGILGLILVTSIVRKDRKFPSEKATLFIISFFSVFIISIWLLFTILLIPLL